MGYTKGEKVAAGVWRLKNSKLYVAEVSYSDPDTGKRIRNRKTTHRLDLAENWRKTHQTDALRGEISRKKKRRVVLFRDFANEYFKAWSPKRKPSTVRGEKFRINGILLPYFGDTPLHTIVRKDIETYIANRRESGVTVASTNRELCRLRNMFSVAVGWGYLESNPLAGLKQEKEMVEEADFLSREEVTRLLSVCNDRIRPLLVTAVYTGMRWGELMKLEWRDVDFSRSIITARYTKNSETRYVPMNPVVKQTLEAHRKNQVQEEGKIAVIVFSNPDTGQAWTNIRKSFISSLRDAGIERHFTFHGLRHTTASHLIMSGVDLRTTAKILGHKDLKMTLRYSHLAPDFLQDAVDQLDFSIDNEAATD